MQADDTPIEISPLEVNTLLVQADDGTRDFRLIDCREEDEWQICHLPHATLVPLSRFGELAPEAFKDTQEHLIIYCHHGMRSLRAAEWLKSRGFAKVQSMRGGVAAWADGVDPEMARY